METNPDASLQEAGAVVCTGLEGASGLDRDPLLSQEEGGGIEAETTGVRAKGSFFFWLSLDRLLRVGIRQRQAGERGETLGSLGEAQPFKAPDEINDITAGLAAGEAVPEVFREADDKGRAITAVNRAGSDEPIASYPEALRQPVGGQNLFDGHGLLEDLEVEVRWNHDFPRIKRQRSCHRQSHDV